MLLQDSNQDYVAKFSLPVLFSLGFRPFYFAGSLYAVISMGVWIGFLTGHLTIRGPFDGVLWHAHELIYGFAVAILIGFLFTAGSNWSRRPTPSGWSLAGLLVLWAFGRLILLIDDSILAMAIDLAFLPLAALGVGVPLIKSRNSRNYFVLVLIFALWVSNLGFYAVADEWIEVDIDQFFTVAISVFALFISVIGGRVIPFFAKNVLGETLAQRHQWLEYASALALLLSVMFDAAFGSDEGPVWLRFAVLMLVVLLHLAKIVAWRPWVMVSRPILFILPLSYAWLPVGFLLRALSVLDLGIDALLGLHAITVGAIAGMMLAMMTRSSLGHTGRAIKASAVDLMIYGSIMTAALVRVFAPLVLPDLYLMELSISASLWCSAFGLFCIRYWPILSRPRFF